jgi:hypothetical protein
MFFANQSLPWPVVKSEDPELRKHDSPLAVVCGVKALPQTVLLDGNGKVIAVNISGNKLNEKLAEILGPGQKLPGKVSRKPGPLRPAE